MDPRLNRARAITVGDVEDTLAQLVIAEQHGGRVDMAVILDAFQTALDLPERNASQIDAGEFPDDDRTGT